MTYDFDQHEYAPIRDGLERARMRLLMGAKNEWAVAYWPASGGHAARYVIESCTHDDDVVLMLSGNFLPEQAQRIAAEICEQLNAAERKFDTLTCDIPVE